MTLGLNGTNQNEVDAALRSLKIIWLAILAAVVLLFVVTRVVSPVATNNNPVIFWMLMALGLMTFGMSFFMKQKTLKEAVVKKSLGGVRIAYIIALALCEATALFGVVAFFVTGVEYYYFFFVLGGFGILLHKPQRDDLLAATGKDELWK